LGFLSRTTSYPPLACQLPLYSEGIVDQQDSIALDDSISEFVENGDGEPGKESTQMTQPPPWTPLIISSDACFSLSGLLACSRVAKAGFVDTLVNVFEPPMLGDTPNSMPPQRLPFPQAVPLQDNPSLVTSDKP
jgi:hypothetical protein